VTWRAGPHRALVSERPWADERRGGGRRSTEFCGQTPPRAAANAFAGRAAARLSRRHLGAPRDRDGENPGRVAAVSRPNWRSALTRIQLAPATPCAEKQVLGPIAHGAWRPATQPVAQVANTRAGAKQAGVRHLHSCRRGIELKPHVGLSSLQSSTSERPLLPCRDAGESASESVMASRF
jgi:hypothetical protein